MKKTENLQMGEILILKPVVVITEKRGFLIQDVAKQYGFLTAFLGFEPPIHIENGELAIKIKGFGKIKAGQIIVMESKSVVNIVSKDTTVYEVVTTEKLELEPKKSDEQPETEKGKK